MAGKQPIPGIAPVAPAVSLVSSGARPLPADVNWQSGVSWRSIACANAERYPDCDPSPSRAATVDITQPAFSPFNIALGYACDWVEDSAEHEREARAALDARTAWHLSRELWAGGNVDATTPTLMSAATAIGTAAVHPVAAIGSLVSSWLDCTEAGGPILHVPSILIPSLFANGQIAQQGDTYYGPLGSVISPGPGYPNTGAATGPAGANADANSAWIYVTGPVEYATGPITISETESWNPRLNRYEVHPTRRAIFRFDPCCVFAIETLIPAPGAGVA